MGNFDKRHISIKVKVTAGFEYYYQTTIVQDETNIYYEPFHHITVQPNTDIFSYLAKDFRENKNLTCRKCTTQSCQSLRTSYQEMPNILLIQNNRFSVYKNLTCRKCTTQSCQSLHTSYQETPNILLIQINRFSVSNLHCRPQKNNHPLGIYENIKLGLINYTLLGLIEHHGVFIDSGHYVRYIRQSNKWYHCDDKHITETNLLTLSNNVYLMFYSKEVDI